MWSKDKSCRLFDRQYLKRNGVELHDDITELLGQPITASDYRRYDSLNRLIEAFDVSVGSYNSKEAVAGLSFGSNQWVECSREPDAACIAISSQYVKLIARIVDVDLGFPAYLEWASALRDADLAQVIDGGRNGVFRYFGADYEGEHQSYADDSDIWRKSRGLGRRRRSALGAIFFALGHELGHLLHWRDENKKFDKASRKKAYPSERRERLDKLRDAIGPLVPLDNPSHQNEHLADHAAVEYTAVACKSAGIPLVYVMKGSFLTFLATGFDGWFHDGSRVSDSHPSAWARMHSVLTAWGDFLLRQDDGGWVDVRRPTPEQLYDVANTFVFCEWAAGLYGSHRNGGRAMFRDREDAFKVLKMAAGLQEG